MKLGTLAGLGLALLSVGCNGISTSTDYDPNFDFSGLNSFYWMDNLGQVDDSVYPGVVCSAGVISSRQAALPEPSTGSALPVRASSPHSHPRANAHRTAPQAHAT